MSEQIKEAVLISASPKAKQEKALSEYFSSLGESHIKSSQIHVSRINVYKSMVKGHTEEEFKVMADADALIVIFPLYFFCLPGMLMRFLQDYEKYLAVQENETKKALVFAVINCGFPEPEINEEAVRVIESFSQKVGAEFRFGVLIGGGGMIVGAKEAPFMKRTMAKIVSAFELMKDDISANCRSACENIYIKVNFPRKLYFFMGNCGWSSSARRYGLKKKDLYRKVY